MMGVLGIGGLFLRARDPEALADWYARHLGVGAGLAAEGAGQAGPWSWAACGGPVVFAPFPADSDYLAADKAFMLNLRVDALDALIAALRAAGIVVETRAEWDAPETGRFARIHDPEGNPIELWEPPAA
jgi:catechol 2,3-dioxygenase-like lactoylglutathione lyase family enzyme